MGSCRARGVRCYRLEKVDLELGLERHDSLLPGLRAGAANPTATHLADAVLHGHLLDPDVEHFLDGAADVGLIGLFDHLEGVRVVAIRAMHALLGDEGTQDHLMGRKAGRKSREGSDGH